MHDNTLILSTPEGETFSGYLATAASGSGPGIVMVQEIFGVNPSIREAADRFAAEGYTVLAPDLFWRFQPNLQLGYAGPDLEQAFDYYHRFNIEQGVSDIGQAVAALRQHPACNGKVAVLGFCLGGKLAFLTAAQYPLDAMVAFYGGGIASHLELASNIHCPVLMHFGQDDEMIPAEQTEQIQAAFAQRANAAINVYPNVGHAFYNHHRASYNPQAAELVHNQTLDFLAKALK